MLLCYLQHTIKEQISMCQQIEQNKFTDKPFSDFKNVMDKVQRTLYLQVKDN